jgi:GDP-D-mannose 3',5'-epimerase
VTKAIVTGAAGFIGHHLIEALRRDGHHVRGIDVRPPQWGPSAADEFLIADLRDPRAAAEAIVGADALYALAADMGGMGYLATHGATILRNNLLIDANTIDAAARAGVGRLFYASSACVYPQGLQKDADARALTEDDALPADPPDAYGWEKLAGELLCREYPVPTRVARFHNIFGPYGSWNDGREKAPAALCRKVAEAKRDGKRSIEIWGDGRQSRSFCYVDDCVDGILRLTRSDEDRPVNIGQERGITIDDLAQLIASIAGVTLALEHVDGPEGVRSRNADTTLARTVLGWTPRVTLEEGLRKTYAWIEAQVNGS